MQNLSGSVATRLEALEENKLDKGSLGVEFAALLQEMSVLNSNVKALTKALIINWKQTQDATQQKSKQDGEKTLASSTPNGKTGKEVPGASHSPCTKKLGSQKGNGSCEAGPQVSERTRSNSRHQSQTRNKEIVRPRSPPRGIIHVQAMVPINVPSSSTEDDEDATTLEEGRHGSASPGTDGVFAPTHAKLKPTQKPRKRATSNAQGKAIAKEAALNAEKRAAREAALGMTTAPSKKVCRDGQHGSFTNCHRDQPIPIVHKTIERYIEH